MLFLNCISLKQFLCQRHILGCHILVPFNSSPCLWLSSFHSLFPASKIWGFPRPLYHVLSWTQDFGLGSKVFYVFPCIRWAYSPSCRAEKPCPEMLLIICTRSREQVKNEQENLSPWWVEPHTHVQSFLPYLTSQISCFS